MKNGIDEIDKIIKAKISNGTLDKKTYGGQLKIREWSPKKTRVWNEQARMSNAKVIEKCVGSTYKNGK